MGDVDFERGSIRVSRSYGDVAREDGTTKSGKRRTVPMNDQCAAAFDGLLRREGFTGRADRVFVSESGGPLPDNAGRLALYPALDGAGLGQLRTGRRPFRFHDLRHTSGTLCASRA